MWTQRPAATRSGRTGYGKGWLKFSMLSRELS